MKELLIKVKKGNYFLPKTLSKETVSFLNCMLQYDPKRRLSADKLFKHKFLKENYKEFQKIDLKEVKKKVKGSNIKINSIKNESIWDIFGDGVVDSINEVIDEEENKNSNELVEIGNSLTSSIFGEINNVDKIDQHIIKPNKLQNNLDEIFIKAMKQINIDSSIFEPKLLPFIPGLEPDIDNINII